MAFAKNVLLGLLLVAIATLIGGCVGSVYRVGDSDGWTMMDADYYHNWASSKTFRLGDSLVFEYDTDFHNVREVSLEDFESCNPTSPLARFDSGSDSVDLTRPGHRYFICGVPDHCFAGQKLHVNVVEPTSTMQPPSSSYSPAPSPLENSPANDPTRMVSPGMNGAMRSRVSTGLSCLLVLSLVVGWLFF